MTTTTKAQAAGVSGLVMVIVSWLISRIPGWGTVPPDVQHAVLTLVAMGLPFAAVYFAPANRAIMPDPPAPEPKA